MAENPITKEEVLDEFLVTSMYGKSGGWPHETVAACKIICTDEHNHEWVSHQVYRNDEKHAEVRLIEYLRWNLDVLQARKIEIEVYINYSPCSSCAIEILDYVIAMKVLKREMKMTIAFANFYLTHEFTYQRKDGTTGGNRPEDAKRNIEGLQKLRERGVELQLLGAHVKWETFLVMSKFFDLSKSDKDKCLGKANSDDRKRREEIDKKFWGKIFKVDELSSDLSTKLKVKK